MSGSLIASSFLGILGLSLIFFPEVTSVHWDETILMSLGVSLLGAFLSGLGNLAAVLTHEKGVRVIHANALAMSYGAILSCAIAVYQGAPFQFDVSLPYVASLLYLSIFGSLIAFGIYVTLLGRIGLDRAAQPMVFIPVVSLIISQIFEKTNWTWISGTGAFLMICGIYLAVFKKSSRIAFKRSSGEYSVHS